MHGFIRWITTKNLNNAAISIKMSMMLKTEDVSCCMVATGLVKTEITIVFVVVQRPKGRAKMSLEIVNNLMR